MNYFLGSNTAENLWEKFINTILEPLKRKKGTLQLRNLIAKANQVLSSQYPDYRRSEMFNMLDHFIEVGKHRTTLSIAL